MVSFSWPGFIVSAIIVVAGVWGYRAERRFLSYLKPEEKMWSFTLGTFINICLLFFCVMFTFELYTSKKMFSLLLATLTVFLIVLLVYLIIRWRISLRLFGREAREGIESLREEIKQLAGGASDDGAARKTRKGE